MNNLDQSMQMIDVVTAQIEQNRRDEAERKEAERTEYQEAMNDCNMREGDFL
jgi:hypothetical protein